jgi:hypothetical protein
MNRFLVPVAAVTGVLLIAAGIFLAGGLVATNALASGMGLAGDAAWGRGDHGAWAAQLPPEVKGLGDIPAADRFSHFRGVTVNLTDKNNQPLAVTVTPGTVSAVSGNSLTLAANDGSTKAYAIDNKTIEKGTPANSDKVAVVTINGSTTATAVMTVPAQGFGPHTR